MCLHCMHHTHIILYASYALYIRTSHCMHTMHTLDSSDSHIYVVYASHVLCVLVLTWVNRILSNNSEVSCLVLSDVSIVVHTEHLGVRGDGEGVDVGQVALVLDQTTTRMRGEELVLDQTTSRDHQDMCRLGNISLHGHTRTVLHVTHISHWRTEVTLHYQNTCTCPHSALQVCRTC